MILDIGSGAKNKYHKLLNGVNVIHADLDRNAYHLEVLCDAHELPFKENCFSIVHASHILEHLENPVKAILEMRRVTRNRVVIKVPNESYFKWKSSGSGHIFGWNKYTLYNLLSKYFSSVVIHDSLRVTSASRLRKALMLILTLFHGKNELVAECRK